MNQVAGRVEQCRLMGRALTVRCLTAAALEGCSLDVGCAYERLARAILGMSPEHVATTTTETLLRIGTLVAHAATSGRQRRLSAASHPTTPTSASCRCPCTAPIRPRSPARAPSATQRCSR